LKVLLLAPQPFFRERGTPIAVDLVARALSERGNTIDLLTYHIGEEVSHRNVRIHRIPRVPFVRDVPAGFSLRKLVCSLLLTARALKMARNGGYDVVHAVEEAVFTAILIRWLYGVPFIYDMDSSLPQQVVNVVPVLRPLQGWMTLCERWAVNSAELVLAVCEPVAAAARQHRRHGIVLLPDVILSTVYAAGSPQRPSLREESGAHGPIVMYVGSLESNRGIKMLLESFAIALADVPHAHLVIIGGTHAQVASYQKLADQLGLAGSVSLLGSRPIGQLAGLLEQADVLVSSQLEETNTPMKIYSYLAAGKPVLATDLSAHRAIVDERSAVLAAPDPPAFAAALVRLLSDSHLRRRLGDSGLNLVAEKYDYANFRQRLWDAYDQLGLADGTIPSRSSRARPPRRDGYTGIALLLLKFLQG
jgi:glycosyltransferase involved in cell wall biosynthesis